MDDKKNSYISLSFKKDFIELIREKTDDDPHYYSMADFCRHAIIEKLDKIEELERANNTLVAMGENR